MGAFRLWLPLFWNWFSGSSRKDESDSACARQGTEQRILYDSLYDKITAESWSDWAPVWWKELSGFVFFFCTVLQFLVINVLNPVIFTNLSKCLFLKCANSRSKLVYKTEQLALLGSLWYGLYSKIQSIEKCHTFLKLYSQQRNAQCKEKVFLCDAMPWLIGGPLCWAQQACSCAWVQVHAQVCCWLRSHHLAGQSPEEGYRRVNCLGNFSGICIINANEVLACRCSQLCKQKWWNMTSFWTNLWFYTGCH